MEDPDLWPNQRPQKTRGPLNSRALVKKMAKQNRIRRAKERGLSQCATWTEICQTQQREEAQ